MLNFHLGLPPEAEGYLTKVHANVKYVFQLVESPYCRCCLAIHSKQHIGFNEKRGVLKLVTCSVGELEMPWALRSSATSYEEYM